MEDALPEGSQPVNSDGSYKWKYHPDDLLTTQQASDELNVKPKTLAKWRREGTGPEFISLSKTRVGYTYRSILEWMKARTHKSTHDAYIAEFQSGGA